MKIDEFLKLYSSRELCLHTKFAEKQAAYGADEDAFKNNRRAAALAGLSVERWLITQFAKHAAQLCSLAEKITSANDTIDDDELEMWRESMDDISTWMFILNGLLEERYQRSVH